MEGENADGARATRGRPKKTDNKAEEVDTNPNEEPTGTLPAKLKEKRKRKDESEAGNGGSTPAGDAEGVDATPSSSAAFFILTSAASGGDAGHAAAAEETEQPEKIQKVVNVAALTSGKRGRPKGSGKSSTWIPPIERESNLQYQQQLQQEHVDTSAYKPRRVADANNGGHSLLTVADESVSAAVAAPMASHVPAAPAPVKSARGRPKGVSGQSTWIPPSMREPPQ